MKKAYCLKALGANSVVTLREVSSNVLKAQCAAIQPLRAHEKGLMIYNTTMQYLRVFATRGTMNWQLQP